MCEAPFLRYEGIIHLFDGVYLSGGDAFFS